MTIFMSITHQILRAIRVTNSNMRWAWHVPRMWRNMLRKYKEKDYLQDVDGKIILSGSLKHDGREQTGCTLPMTRKSGELL